MGASIGVTVECKLCLSGKATSIAAASGGSGSVPIGGIFPTGGGRGNQMHKLQNHHYATLET